MNEYDLALIDWPSAIEAAAKRLHVRLRPLIQGALLEAYLDVDDPALTPAMRLAGNALIELHKLIDLDSGVLSTELEAIPSLARARMLRRAAVSPPAGRDPADEPDMGRFYARALSELLESIFALKGFEFVVSMGTTAPAADD